MQTLKQAEMVIGHTNSGQVVIKVPPEFKGEISIDPTQAHWLGQALIKSAAIAFQVLAKSN